MCSIANLLRVACFLFSVCLELRAFLLNAIKRDALSRAECMLSMVLRWEEGGLSLLFVVAVLLCCLLLLYDCGPGRN